MAVIVVMFINHIVIVCYVLYAESNIRETTLLLRQNVLIKRNELNKKGYPTQFPCTETPVSMRGNASIHAEKL